jgi:hypothetical protein
MRSVLLYNTPLTDEKQVKIENVELAKKKISLKNGRFDLSRSSKIKFQVSTEIIIYDFLFECAII